MYICTYNRSIVCALVRSQRGAKAIGAIDSWAYSSSGCRGVMVHLTP